MGNCCSNNSELLWFIILFLLLLFKISLTFLPVVLSQLYANFTNLNSSFSLQPGISGLSFPLNLKYLETTPLILEIVENCKKITKSEFSILFGSVDV